MLGKKVNSFKHAWNGIAIAWNEEFSFRVQVAAATLVLFLGWYFGISKAEWLTLVIVIGFVLSAESFNTALEELCDKFKLDPDPHIGKIKDLAAAAVLIASCAALAAGALVFLPYIAPW
jgi:diacylglycerol kinase